LQAAKKRLGRTNIGKTKIFVRGPNGGQKKKKCFKRGEV